VLDDPRRKAVAAVGDLSHRASLPLGRACGLSGYPDKPTMPIDSAMLAAFRPKWYASAEGAAAASRGEEHS
jgi:hypothetical protein